MCQALGEGFRQAALPNFRLRAVDRIRNALEVRGLRLEVEYEIGGTRIPVARLPD